jgi:hypothetical protein
LRKGLLAGATGEEERTIDIEEADVHAESQALSRESRARPGKHTQVRVPSQIACILLTSWQQFLALDSWLLTFDFS